MLGQFEKTCHQEVKKLCYLCTFLFTSQLNEMLLKSEEYTFGGALNGAMFGAYVACWIKPFARTVQI